ncbi:tetratricopeptide repeat protein [Saccharicrinis aurantiacus]|uniref:tetratricopeptide repeat protein n=1 Tax=Saccharicrinis aurantiacus TaxID=1849719 RepID=UPI00248FCAB3|nr:tetratricopeptide repeat protein [Saccharicrinis aurantiacus]
MINIKQLSVIVLTLLIFSNIEAQKSLGVVQPINLFDEGVELYRLGKYGSARDQFEKALKNWRDAETNQYAEAKYYRALCAKELENDDATYLFEKFIHNHPESNKKDYAYFHLGDLQLKNKKYRSALRQFEKVNSRSLDKETLQEYKFKKGYCHFEQEEFDVANRYFNDLKNIDGKYYEASNYYYAHIQYRKENYDTALKSFNKLNDSPSFSKVVPFYIAQIYFLQKEYDKAIEYALPMLDNGSNKRKADMYRIVGEAYFAKKEYAKSIEYLEETIRLSSKARREDYYHLGFSFYYMKDYSKAADNLSRVTGEADEMSQNAFYHLADCYIKSDEKKRARVAFDAASKYSFDKDIQEDALFNTIKLNYELSFSPFNETINSFLDFIEKFPNSDKIDLAYDYLGRVFLTTKNYKSALDALENIQMKNARIYEALQRVAYFHAIDLFTNLRFADAIDYFSYSLKYKTYNHNLELKAYYWRGEAKYRLRKYEAAVADYNTYILNPGSFNTGHFDLAHYNIAYAEFKQKNYTEAQSWWRKYISLEKDKSSRTIGDAYNRIGDCYFVQRDFNTAISYYNQGASISKSSPDYAMYQEAISLGILKKHDAKIAELQDIVQKYPSSPYVDDALYEMGQSYVTIGKYDDAIRKFKTIKEKYPSSSYSKKAMLQLGLVYYNNNDYNNSLSFYKRVINEYPNSEEAQASLQGVRNIYMDRNDLNGYVKYTKGLGSFAQIDVREQDSLSYVSAEKYYMEGNSEAAVSSFRKYLDKYPQGLFETNANYYLADCLYKKGAKAEALQAFTNVTQRGKNIFSEDALLRKGEISFGMQKFADALQAFKELESIAEIAENKVEAQIGVMRCYNELTNYNDCIEAADKLMLNNRVAAEIVREARYLKAKALLNKGQKELAIEEFKVLSESPQSAEGAESRYIVANYYFEKGEKEKAENEVFDLANKGTSHQYWLARCFILLSDIYESGSEYFQAKQYLESINENYQATDDDIKPMVKERLKLLERKMAVVSELKSDSITIQ